MRRLVFVSSGAEDSLVWNIGIDFPNGIRNLPHFKEKIKSPGLPTTLAFHSPHGLKDLTCQEVLLWVLEEDKRRGYVWMAVSLVFDFTAIDNDVAAERMVKLVVAHFKEKHKALNLPYNFIT